MTNPLGHAADVQVKSIHRVFVWWEGYGGCRVYALKITNKKKEKVKGPVISLGPFLSRVTGGLGSVFVCTLMARSGSAVTLLDSSTRLLVWISSSDSWPAQLELHSCLGLTLGPLSSRCSPRSGSQITATPPASPHTRNWFAGILVINTININYISHCWLE